MTQPKRKKNEQAKLVKLFRIVAPGDFVEVLENGIQRIIETELSVILGAEPYQLSEQRNNYRNGCRERKEPPAPSGIYPARIFGRLDQWQDLSVRAFGKNQRTPEKTYTC